MKPIWKSKTFWVALISFIAVFVAEAFGVNVSGEIQAAVMSMIMIVMRTITKDEVTISLK